MGFDIALGGLPFEEAAVDRSSLFAFPPDVRLRTYVGSQLAPLVELKDAPEILDRLEQRMTELAP